MKSCPVGGNIDCDKTMQSKIIAIYSNLHMLVLRVSGGNTINVTIHQSSKKAALHLIASLEAEFGSTSNRCPFIVS